MLNKFKKPLIMLAAISLAFLLFSQTTIGKRLLLPAGLIEAIKTFFAGNPQLHVCDYRDGEILFIKPIKTGAGNGAYEAGDIIEIKDGQMLCDRFEDRDFLGISEKTDYLIVYLGTKLTEKQKRDLTESEYEIITNSDEREATATGAMVKRRKAGVDYSMFLSDREIISGATFEKLDKILEVDLAPIKTKTPEQKSVVVLPKYIALLQKGISLTKEIGQKIIKPVFAQTEVLKVVDPDNGAGTDYTSLNLWEAQNLDLVTLNQIAVAKCRSTGGTADTTAVYIIGWTTSATQYIKIWTDPTESYRHNGKWDTSKYRLELIDNLGFRNEEDFVRVEGLQIKITYNASVPMHCFGDDQGGVASGADVRFSNNICRTDGTGTASEMHGVRMNYYGSGTRYMRIWNNIFYDFNSGSSQRYGIVDAAGWTAYIYNNTFYNCDIGFRSINWTALLRNNLFSNCTYAVTDSSETAYGWVDAGSDYNATNNASMNYNATGAHDRKNQTFAFVDAAASDLHLRLGDSAARGAGANLRNDANLAFSTDIDNENRSETGTWDIGADEVARTTVINSPRGMTESLSSGLVGYWSFDGPKMIWSSATTGTSTDSSGNNNNGTLTNMSRSSTPAPGISGQALSFDGTNDLIVVSDSSSLEGMSGLTFSAWVKFDRLPSTTGSNGLVLTKRHSVSPYYSYDSVIQSSNNGMNWQVNTSGGAQGAQGATSLQVNKWYNLVGLYDGSNVHVYLNGVLDDAWTPGGLTGTVYDSDSALYLGGYNTFSDASVDEVRIYNRALSASEIQDLYRAGAARLKVNTPITKAGPQSGLVGNWSFNGQDTNWTSAIAGTTNDLSGNNNTGTMTNMSRSSSPKPGINGSALSFDGVDDYVNAYSAVSLDDIELQGGGGMTISAWIYPKSFGGQTLGHIFNKGQGESGEWLLRLDGGNNAFQFSKDYQTTNLNIRTDIAPVLNTWQYIVITWDGSAASANIRAYINGNQSTIWGTDGQGTKNSDANSNLLVGSDSYSETFDGLIDEVRIYNRALSASEILELYRLGTRTTKFKQ